MSKLARNIIISQFANRVVGIDNPTFVNGRTAREYAHPIKNLKGITREAKMRLSAELDNLIDAGENMRNVPDRESGHFHKDVIGGFDRSDSIFKIGNRYYQAQINVKNIEKGRLMNDATKIKDITQDITNSYGENPKFGFLRNASTSSGAQSERNSKKHFVDNNKTKPSRFVREEFQQEQLRSETQKQRRELTILHGENNQRHPHRGNRRGRVRLDALG